MPDKKLIYLGLFLGSTIGGLIPSLWGANPFSLSSVLFAAIGSILGIWLAYKFVNF